ncbi:MAG: histidine--tRNA ligase [Bacteroidetes bacterium]|nr:histidine--tRNA ligase [Bacteroidota bacterium]
MSKQKPTIPQGTRDFGPAEMLGREFIFDTLRRVFKRYGYQPIETPSIEQLSVLTGKYGEEGDRLIFKIVNSGDYLDDALKQNFDFHQPAASLKLLPKISEKALRYDLTVPFARYVVMNQHKLTFPFKRYQIQPVWRADRPQKGRYREFYQCDVDVVGSNGLLNELELVRICDEGFSQLGVEGVTLRVNNRKLLEGIAVYFGAGDRFVEFITILDKLDKVGEDGIFAEWTEKGFSVEPERFRFIQSLAKMPVSRALEELKTLIGPANAVGQLGIQELSTLFGLIDLRKANSIQVTLDIFLARGLGYYTGTIFEAGTHDFRGSILGGGRYDNLTGVFGLDGVSGVGISFGADRIFDILQSRGILEKLRRHGKRVLLANFGGSGEAKAVEVWMDMLDAGYAAEVYPEVAKPAKQFKYADQAGFSYVISIGDREVETGVLNFKDLTTGLQQTIPFAEAMDFFSKVLTVDVDA